MMSKVERIAAGMVTVATGFMLACSQNGEPVATSDVAPAAGNPLDAVIAERGLTPEEAEAALKTFVPPGRYDEFVMFAFITASPFVYMTHFGVSPRGYAWLLGTNIFGVVLVTLLNARLVPRLGPMTMIALGVGATLLACAGLLACAFSGSGGLAAIVLCVVLYVSATGLFGANCIASLMALYPHRAGAAAGLAIATQFALAAACSALAGALADGTPGPMCLVMAGAGLGCVLCFGVIRSFARQSVGAAARG